MRRFTRLTNPFSKEVGMQKLKVGEIAVSRLDDAIPRSGSSLLRGARLALPARWQATNASST
jgi:hypothetical protein